MPSLPAVPAAAAFGAADEEAEQPEDQPDHEQDPEDVEGRHHESAPSQKQDQQNQNDQRNQSRFTSLLVSVWSIANPNYFDGDAIALGEALVPPPLPGAGDETVGFWTGAVGRVLNQFHC